MQVVKVYRERMPAVRLAGRKYSDKDRGFDGTFAARWSEWMEKGWFHPLTELGVVPECEDSYLGCMRAYKGKFEYWIGVFLPAGTQPPRGYEYVDIPAGDVATAWLQGNEDNGELYGEEAYEACVRRFLDKNWEIVDDPWIIERYHGTRFTSRDANGNVILDYCMYIK